MNDFAVVTWYWNPAGHDPARSNFLRFMHDMKRFGVPVMAAEVAYGDAPFVCEDSFLKLRGSESTVLWQIERLVNLVVERLAPQFKKIAWVDPDVVFLDPEWVTRASELLDACNLVQLWDRAVCIGKDGATERTMTSVGHAGYRYRAKEVTATGYAWAARREMFPLYDRHVAGLNETICLEAWLNIERTGLSHESQWAEQAFAKAQGSITTLPSDIVVLHSQLRENGGKNLRSQLSAFDPAVHLAVDSQGLLSWSADAPSPLARRVRDYYRDTLPARPRSKPKVAIITPTFGLGGAEQWVRCLVTHCKEFDWKVGVLYSDPLHPLVANATVAAAEVHGPEGIHEKVITHSTVNDICAAAIEDADAVITWGGGMYWPLPTQAPIIFVAHGTCQWTAAAATHALNGGAKYFVGVSKAVSDSIKPAVPTQEVTTIINGVDSTRLSVPPDKAAIRARWMGNPYTYARFVGFMGRLGNEKNPDQIVYAITSLPYHYQLVLIGCTGWRAEQILKMARTVLRDRLIEVPATDEIGEQLGALDCLVQVSPKEGHSLTLCEAWLCKVPVVSNYTGALPELEAMAGRELIERVPDIPLTTDVAQAIRTVCESKPAERIEAAYDFAAQHLTHEAMCRQWTAYLHSIIKEKR